MHTVFHLTHEDQKVSNFNLRGPLIMSKINFNNVENTGLVENFS